MTYGYRHGPCPCGVSSDAYCTYDDGHSYCYRCNKFDGVASDVNTNKEYIFHETRGISYSTLKHYNVVTECDGTEPKVTAFPYGTDAFKYRRVEKKEFWTAGPIANSGVFGKQVADPGSKESITITEGEFDALSIYEVTNGATAAVSVQSSSSAKRDCKLDYEYINSFSRIILFLDSDEPGRAASEAVAALFDPKKVYYVIPEKFKDANEYLQNKEPAALLAAWKGATKKAPEGIVHKFSDLAKALEEKGAAKICTYPFDCLEQALFGIHSGEFVLFKGLEGIGKTEVFRAIEHHILKTTDANVGIIRLEETIPDTVKGIATYELQAPAMMETSGISNVEIMRAYASAVGEREDRLYLQSTFDVDDPDVLLANIRFIVNGGDCRVVMLDHLSMAITGRGEEDERKKLDYFVTRLKKMAVADNFAIVSIIHVNDDGRTRSSRYPPKIANTVIHLERDVKHPNPIERKKLHFIVEKGRGQGTRTGPVGSAIYDDEISYTLKEVKDEIRQSIIEAIS